MDCIDDWRERIDRIDARILELLGERARCAIEIGRIKAGEGLDILNQEREKFILDRLKGMNAGPLDSGAIERIFGRIIEECRRTEHLS